MTDDEKRMTRREWREHELRARCESDRHQPYHRLATYGDPVGAYFCECGRVTWKPTSREDA